MQTAEDFIAQRYSRSVALQHEFVYGVGYQGPAELAVFDHLADSVGPRLTGGRVLDLGCGLGGDAIRLRRQRDAQVVAVDASPDMIALCRERAEQEGEETVKFVLDDIVSCEPLSRPSHFDVVWSRDCGAFLPFRRKETVWSAAVESLRPGGRLLITDYCLGPGTAQTALVEQMLSWGQYMTNPEHYSALLGGVGCTDVEVTDRTDLLLSSMHGGMSKLLERRTEFVARFGAEAYGSILARWKRKIEYCDRADLVWTVVTATRPPR